VIQSEAHSLQVGQHFSFDPELPAVAEVGETGRIEAYGEVLVLYLLDGAWHGHLSDHTPVWIA